ncbi:MAG TPA: sensor histidine kinase [Candidatus Dormibacteraeota bacterium]|nr:sensor histidine kinase [Candidatus Dormibacteraeota bacterium]
MEAVSRGSVRRPGADPRRAWVADALPVAVVVVLVAALDVDNHAESGGAGAALLGLAVSAPLLWRRRAPLPVFAVVAVCAIAVGGVLPYPCITAAVVAGYSLAAYDRRWWLSLAVVGATGIVVAVVFPGPLPPVPAAFTPFLLLLVPWLAGNGVRLHAARADSSESRARQLERERDEAERRLRMERTRIARELHDVVAHSVSVMVVQAGAARQVVRSKPDRAVEALLAVEESGRDAMGELRSLLGLLADTHEAPLAPQPGLDAAAALVDRVRAAGLAVELHVEGVPGRLPPGVDLAAYRVVQEALTNALKHSGGAATRVRLIYTEEVLRVDVSDDGCASTTPGDGTGQGLAGMRERVALYGGTLDAGRRPAGGYSVVACFPLPAG